MSSMEELQKQLHTLRTERIAKDLEIAAMIQRIIDMRTDD